MKVEVIPVRVKPATVKKLRADVDRVKQDAATDKLLAGASHDTDIMELKKAMAALEKRISLLEQP